MDQQNRTSQHAANDNAEELTRLAQSADSPGERAWFLQWAKAFRRLADLGADRPRREDR